jgi:hypothetical protein
MRVSPVARFVVACCLFAGWIGWLSWMAAMPKQTTLSRPQLLVSEIDVVAEVPALDQPIVVEKVLHGDIKPGATLRVDNLADCKRLRRKDEKPGDVPLDWTGPGRYLLPLRTSGKSYLVVVTPPSPGYPPGDPETTRGSPRIYHADDEVLEQYREIRGSP